MKPETRHELLRWLWANDPQLNRAASSELSTSAENRGKLLERLRSPRTTYECVVAVLDGVGPFEGEFITHDREFVGRLLTGWLRHGLKTDSVYRLLTSVAGKLSPEKLVGSLPNDNALNLLVLTGSPLAFDPARHALEESRYGVPFDLLDFSKIDHPEVASVLIKHWVANGDGMTEREAGDLIKALGGKLPNALALDALLALVDSDSLFVRATACEVLRGSKVFASVTKLSKLAKLVEGK